MDNQTRRIIWSMSDVDSDALLAIIRKHMKLILELISANTLHERRDTLRVEIQTLIGQRNELIEKYKNQ